MSLMSNETRVLIGDAWRRYGRDPIIVGGKLNKAQRDALHIACESAEQLVYVPSELTTGLLPGTDVQDLDVIIPNAGGTASDGFRESRAWGNTPRTREIIWGQLNPSTTGNSYGEELMIAGPRPDLVGDLPGSTACVRETNSSVRQATLKHSVFNPLMWCDPDLDPPGGAWDLDEALFLLRNSIGWRGGRYDIQFCEFKNIQDAFHQNTQNTGATDEVHSYRAHCWVHAALFYRGEGHHQPEGTHSDLDQVHRFMHHVSEYNLFGGPNADHSGYSMDPARGTCDGAFNSGTMFQQEVNNDSDNLITDIVYRRNMYWMHTGDGPNINHAGAENPADSKYNPMTDVFFEDNLHVQRGGTYVIRPLLYEDQHINHRIISVPTDGEWTDLGAAPIVRG